MARDLKPGDRIRALSGVAEVRSVAPATVQPVFNLEVADGGNFLVGSHGLLVHDNSIIVPVSDPFDAPLMPRSSAWPGRSNP